MHDVIVVGARCAGSPLAMLLARKGYRVLVVDKARFPSDAVSSHLIWHAGLARAKRWGLLDRILALGAPPIRRVSLDTGDFEFAGSPPPLDGIDYAVAPRRNVLDKLLVDAAREAGAEIREGFYVSEIMVEDGRVTGIRGRTAGGEMMTERAQITVGADGVRSMVASTVRAAKYNTRPSTACAYYAYWRGGPRVTDFENYVRPSFGSALLPTNDGLTCLVGGWKEGFAAAGERPAQTYRRLLHMVSRLSEFSREAEQVGSVKGIREVPGYFREPCGDGWALVGDAGYHKHPLSAQGISDAFRDADLLCDALDEGFSGGSDMADALEQYERLRDAAVTPIYQSTCDRARLEPFSFEALALFRALRTNQHEADRFFGTDAGTVPMAEFFAPRNLERIVQSAPSAAAKSG